MVLDGLGNMIDLIAVSYHGSRDLESFVESLKAQTFSHWQLSIVDNSEDAVEAKAVKAIATRDPRIQLIPVTHNLGYFGGARAALEVLGSDLGRIVIIANVDVVFAESTTLANLVEAAEDSDQDVGIIAPRITSNRDGQDQNPHLIRRPTRSEQRRRMRRMRTPGRAQATILASWMKRQLLGGHRAGSVNDATEIYAAHGAFMVFLREYFSRGGTLAHPTFLFGEELTIAERARGLGLRTVYRPDLVIRHVEHGQMGFVRSRKVLREMGVAAAYGYELVSGAEE